MVFPLLGFSSGQKPYAGPTIFRKLAMPWFYVLHPVFLILFYDSVLFT
jgi:hypothetical protein